MRLSLSSPCLRPPSEAWRRPLCALAAVLAVLATTGCATPGPDGVTARGGLMPSVRDSLRTPSAAATRVGQVPASLAAAAAEVGPGPAPAAAAPPPPSVSAAAPPAAAPTPLVRSIGRMDIDPEAGMAPGAVPPRDDWARAVPPARMERRFSLSLNGASPEVLFMALLNDTPLSVAVDPEVKGPISIALKDVTLREALELLRELHGLEYRVIGRHILVTPAQMQTRIFTIDYPVFSRAGRSDVRVVSGSISSGGGGSSGGSGSSGSGSSGGSNGSSGSNGGSSGGSAGSSPESSRITTNQRSDLWQELEVSVRMLVGEKDGRQVMVSPQTGTLVVRAMPREMRSVEHYLAATRASVERQVMLEAKVVEVQLRDSERTGINWTAFRNGLNSRASGGMVSPGGTLSPTGALNGPNGLASLPGETLEAVSTASGSLLGLAFQTSNFAAVMDFLSTQGNTQVLSSPRIATMNNQKAVLKVGTDDFFVTNISTTTNSVGNSSTTTPNITVQPFFSGIALDVTPNIGADGFITLHVHPAVSNVTERSKVLNLGSLGNFTLPLASSDINESDAVVRARDGQIIAIGGLMRQASVNTDSGVPGTDEGMMRKLLGGQTSRLTEKRELVILLKPTVVDPNGGDDPLRGDALSRLLEWTERTTAAAQPAPAVR